MEKTDYSYAAGIIDGEGHIQITNKYSVCVKVAMTEEYVPLWLQMGFSGSIYFKKQQNKKWKRLTQWTITGNNAIIFLRLILPYLKIKRPQADLAIKFISTKQPTNGNRYNTAEKYLRELQRQEMAKLNKRGLTLVSD